MNDTDNTTEGRLNPDQFRVAARDTQGNFERMQFRGTPGLAYQADLMLNSKKFPYRTKGDIYRHALVKHLEWLHSLKEVPSIMAQVDIINAVMLDEEIAADFQVVFEKIGERMSHYMGTGAMGEARRVYLKIEKLIEDMPSGYWQKKYTKELHDRWGHILTAVSGASLIEGSKEE